MHRHISDLRHHSLNPISFDWNFPSPNNGPRFAWRNLATFPFLFLGFLLAGLALIPPCSLSQFSRSLLYFQYSCSFTV
jgi:hypothetical protein